MGLGQMKRYDDILKMIVQNGTNSATNDVHFFYVKEIIQRDGESDTAHRAAAAMSSMHSDHWDVQNEGDTESHLLENQIYASKSRHDFGDTRLAAKLYSDQELDNQLIFLG